MHLLLRFACVAVPLWLVWSVLIAAASPAPPGRAAQVVFLASALLGLVGCFWAGWHTFAQHAARPWRRFAALSLGAAAFLVIALIGHFLGQSVAALRA